MSCGLILNHYLKYIELPDFFRKNLDVVMIYHACYFVIGRRTEIEAEPPMAIFLTTGTYFGYLTPQIVNLRSSMCQIAPYHHLEKANCCDNIFDQL